MDSLVRFRCSVEERAKWFEAAGGKMKFSSWAREVLNAPCSRGLAEPPSIYLERKEVKQAVTTLSSAKPVTGKGDLRSASVGKAGLPPGVCDKTGYDYLICLC